MICGMELKHRYVAENAERNSRFICMMKLILWKTSYLIVASAVKEMC